VITWQAGELKSVIGTENITVAAVMAQVMLDLSEHDKAGTLTDGLLHLELRIDGPGVLRQLAHRNGQTF
jgi:hypothetical protein